MEGLGPWVDGTRGRELRLTSLPYLRGSWSRGGLSSALGSLGVGVCVEDLDSLSGRYYGYGSAADGPALS